MSEKYPDLQYTDFPEQLDKQMDIKDPTATILPLIRTYNALIANGNFVEAIRLLSENPELRASQMNAEKLLRIHHSILSLQRFFYDNVLDKIYQIGQQKGDWNAYMSSTASGDNKLNMYDIVKYPVDGIYQYFMVISSEINAGDIPTKHPDKYMQMTIKGDKGDSGIGMSPCGEWDSGKSYQPYDLVSHQEWFWYCTESNSGNEPSDDSTVWTKFKITYPSSVKRYSYSLTANVDNQTRFAVPMETFDYKRDVVFVQSGITSLFQGQDFEVVSDGILLTEGVPLGRTIGIYVLKNVEDTTIEPETVTGALIEDGSIPLKKLAEEVPRMDEFEAHIGDVNNPHGVTAAQIGAVAKTGDTMTGNTLNWYNGYGGIWCGEGIINITARNVPNDTSNNRHFNVFSSENRELKDAFSFADTINNTRKYYLAFGEHNKELLSGAEISFPFADGFGGMISAVFWKDTDGTVFLSVGVTKSDGFTGGGNTVIGYLPAGYRPSGTRVAPCLLCDAADGGDIISDVGVYADGTVSVANPGSETRVHAFFNMAFKAYQ